MASAHPRKVVPVAAQSGNPCSLESATAIRKGMVVHEIVDDVVTLIAFCVVLFGVIDHVIGA